MIVLTLTSDCSAGHKILAGFQVIQGITPTDCLTTGCPECM